MSGVYEDRGARMRPAGRLRRRPAAGGAGVSAPGLAGACGASLWSAGRTLALTVFVIAVGMLACSAPAMALAQRGHVYGFSFGGEGEGAGQFRFGGAFKLSEGAGIAVDEASGDVFVVDRGNHRVQEFSETGAFVAAWGWGVSDGKEEYEVCASGCRAGIGATGKGALKEPAAIAVDNSSGSAGTLYVDADGSAKRPDVQMFTAGGEKALGRLPVEEEGRLDGLATDREGRVWLYRGEEEETGVIEGFTDASHPVEVEPVLWSPLACPKPGFGVDAGGEAFYVDHELLTGEGECPAVVEREKEEEGEPAPGKYARPVVAGKLSSEEVLADDGVAISELDREGTSGVAVDQASGEDAPLGPGGKGAVYLDEGASVVELEADGALVQRFGSGELADGMGVAVDSKTGDVYVVDGGDDKVDVFTPEAEGAPVVEDLAAQDLSASEALLSARVEPHGSDTHYYFQYGTADCASEPSACTDTSLPPGADLGGGFGDREVTATLRGLQPSTTYFYRVLAVNSLGAAEAQRSQGTFQTLPSSTGVLADGRAWELVSPAEKDGADIEPLSKEGGLIQASAEGGSITYVSNGPVVSEPEGNRAPEPTQVISSRSAQGWSSQEMVTPRERGEGLEGGEPSEYRFFSEDLALSLVQPTGSQIEPLEAPPLAPGVSEKTLYLRDDPPVAPSPSEQAGYQAAQANSGFLAPGYAPLVDDGNVTAEAQPGEAIRFGGKLTFLDATANLSDVLFESDIGLLAGLEAGLYETEQGGPLTLVSVLPDGAPAPSPALGDESTNVRNAISSDGSRVFFSTEEGEEGEAPGLYVRDTKKAETLEISAAQGGVVEPTGEESEVDFQAATSDGSRVFFTDTAPLTAESTQRQTREADLYECEIIETGGKLACDLKDLTPLPAGGSADVLNVIPGISENGSYVYFVADGVLAPGAKPGECVHEAQEVAPVGATCNLYVWHEGTIAFIAALSNEDSGDWGSLHGSGRVGDYVENRPDLSDVTSRVSPDGEYLAFMSDQPLTGYDNLDANHQSEGVRDEEVYLYQASSNLLTCASCNHNDPSVGVLDTPDAGEGYGLVVDRREDWTGQYLAGSVPGWTPLGVDGATHQPRYLSDSGRLFFNSPDELMPQATNAKEDVYEYEPEGVGSCTQPEGCVSLISSGTAEQESAFLEAGENGDDAFFLTSQPLVAADHDTDFDIYDARVCTSASPCLTTEASSQRPCESTQTCRSAATAPSTFASPASATPTGQGNIPKQETQGATTTKPVATPKPPSRAQELAKALKACRKHERKRKRVACEKQAHKHYPTKATAKKQAKASKQGKAAERARTGGQARRSGGGRG